MFPLYYLNPTDSSTWTNVIPRKVLREEDRFDWDIMHKKMQKASEFEVPKGLLKELPLGNVRLDLNSIHGRAQQTNLEYLLMLDVDRLVWNFRKTANVPAPGRPYGGWEAPNVELRGHFVGHFLSASAQMWASSRNERLNEKMAAVVSALCDCQDIIGTGYLSAFPSDFFERVEALKPVWAPYYTIHKIMAGLLDQYLFANDTRALRMVTWMADYFTKRVKNVILKYTVERHWQSLNEETGGMNDVLYKLYYVTKNSSHLLLAHLFDKPCFLGILAVQADDISGFHANTHIPIVIGSQQRYEITGNPLYREIGKFFMDIVNSSHAYATGGTSVSEFWSEPNRLGSYLRSETEESCTTYNMLKVSRNLFRWTKDMAYVDYYERALTNGVLSIQRGMEPGVMIYMLPLGHGQSKAISQHGWGTVNDSFWCCYGTGIESFSKLGDSIYFEQEGEVPGIYIIQYIKSSVDWESGHLSLVQKVKPVVSWDNHLMLALIVSTEKFQKTNAISSTLNLRIPIWSRSDGAMAALNSKPLSLPSPGNFLSITKIWSTNDVITLTLPISIWTEAIKDDRLEYASHKAIFYGPYLLVGLSSGDMDISPEAADSPSEWMTPVPAEYNSHVITLSKESENLKLAFTKYRADIVLDKLPEPGTNYSVYATFRLIPKDSKTLMAKDAIWKSVMLEPFGHPGMVVMHRGKNENLEVKATSDQNTSVFRLVNGLDKKKDSVSLESESKKGCFVYSEHRLGAVVKLKCNMESWDDDFKEAASFRMRDGISKYDPISFVAKGRTRKFLMQPLFSIRDEKYTVYFNI
ncbi:AbfB domain-containing protein [Heracleum sosnowskyi]|uniref:AbfB domain-containing protein n=1 Tax=Heracleum sosnowskyi TaxID=360622 RepID=A0AAD8GVG1_9APIA|nr:AbfB domain-containing protein [Heracleum sosnowskyi]